MEVKDGKQGIGAEVKRMCSLESAFHDARRLELVRIVTFHLQMCSICTRRKVAFCKPTTPFPQNYRYLE